MARGRPWYQRYPADWIMGTKGLTLEQKGAYNEILEYLNERDHALPDDDRIISTLLGCSPQKWRTIKPVLVQRGHITIHNDYLTNPRFEREKAERDLRKAVAAEDGRKGGKKSAEMRAKQAELDLDENPDSVRARSVRAPAYGETECPPPKTTRLSRRNLAEISLITKTT